MYATKPMIDRIAACGEPPLQVLLSAEDMVADYIKVKLTTERIVAAQESTSNVIHCNGSSIRWDIDTNCEGDTEG